MAWTTQVRMRAFLRMDARTHKRNPCVCAGGLRTACIPLQNIIESTGLYNINLFSLDVEGAEYAVLSTLDLSVTNIEVIVVELDGGDPGRDQQIRDFLAAHGFENAASRHGSIRNACEPGGDCTMNEVFINPNFHSRKSSDGRRTPSFFSYGTGVPC